MVRAAKPGAGVVNGGVSRWLGGGKPPAGFMVCASDKEHSHFSHL